MADRGQRVLFAAGGTGGHLFPAIAVADQLLLEQPDAQVLFVGGKRGMEQRVIGGRAYPLETLEVGQLKGAGISKRIGTLVGLPGATTRALILLRRFRPNVVVGAGGYVSGPVVIAARLLGCPVVLLEQNAIPGMTTRLLARFADRIVVSFAEAAAHLPRRQRIAHLGNPIRPDLVARLSRRSTAAGGSRRPAHHQLLVLGGSQGARPINELATAAAPRLAAALPDLRIVHQCGAADLAWVRQRYRDAGVRARVEAFIDDMATAYAESGLALSRSGATTLAELMVAGLPAVLVPFPQAADDHQTVNARVLADVHAAVVLDQSELSAETLSNTLLALWRDDQRLAAMSASMRQHGSPEAAALVVALIRELARR